MHWCFHVGKNVRNLIPKTEKIKKKYPLQPNKKIQLKFHGLIDGPGPKRHILVRADCFLKWSTAKVVGTTSCKAAIKFMGDYTCTHGIP